MNGSYGRLEFVGHGVDERIMLFVAANLTNKKDGVQHEAGDNQNKKDDAENQQRHLSPIEQNPPYIQRYREQHQADAQHDEEGYGFATTAMHAHSLILKDESGREKTEGGRQKKQSGCFFCLLPTAYCLLPCASQA